MKEVDQILKAINSGKINRGMLICIALEAMEEAGSICVSFGKEFV